MGSTDKYNNICVMGSAQCFSLSCHCSWPYNLWTHNISRSRLVIFATNHRQLCGQCYALDACVLYRQIRTSHILMWTDVSDGDRNRDREHLRTCPFDLWELVFLSLSGVLPVLFLFSFIKFTFCVYCQVSSIDCKHLMLHAWMLVGGQTCTHHPCIRQP